MKKITLFAVLFFLCNTIFSQSSKVNNHWYFASSTTSMGVSFNNPGVAPSVLNDSQAQNAIAATTVSDANGDLLFYFDGTTVRNRHHQAMPNGVLDHLSNSTNEIAEEAIIVPDITNSDRYYIFLGHDTYLNLTQSGYFYSVVDMSLDGGDGAVDLNEGGLLLDQNGGVGLTFTGHKRFSSYHNQSLGIIWVTLLDSQNRQILTYKMDGNGFNNIPVQTSAAINFDILSFTTGGMRISPDGTKIAMSSRLGTQTLGKDAMIADFNQATGAVTNIKAISISNVNDVEFSPDSQTLYLRGPMGIYSQSIPGMNGFPASTPSLVVTRIQGKGSIQLGPDDKLYFNYVFGTAAKLGAIENPNDTPLNLTVNSQVLTLSSTGGSTQSTLPQRVIDLNQCNPFPLRLAALSTTSIEARALPESLYLDHENNILTSTRSDDTNSFSFNNDQISNSGDFIAKFDQSGCFRFAIDNAILKLVDKNDGSFYAITGYSSMGLSNMNFSKFSKDGNLLWSIPDSQLGNIISNAKFQVGYNNKIYMISSLNFYAINPNTGVIESSWLHNIPFISASVSQTDFYVSKNSNHLFVSAPEYIETSPFVFGLRHNISKYQINASSLTLTNSFSSPLESNYISSSIKSGTSVYAHNTVSDKLFIHHSGTRKLLVIDQNLNLLNTVTLPLFGNDFNYPLINFSTDTNKLIIMDVNDGIHSMLDDGNYNVSSIANNSDIKLHYVFQRSNDHIAQLSNNTIYHIGYNPSENYTHFYIQKLNPSSGQALSIAPPLDDEIISFEEEETNSDATIYPNPFNSQLTIKQDQKNQITQVLIYGKLGNILVSQKVKSFSKTIELNTSKLSRGVYFIKTIYSNGESQVKQIIKE